MKTYYALSIIVTGLISTVAGTTLVAAGTAAPKSEIVAVQASSLEALKAQSDSSMTWRRPL
jgi:hypothetical protein